jgi:hypothetical protein
MTSGGTKCLGVLDDDGTILAEERRPTPRDRRARRPPVRLCGALGPAGSLGVGVPAS